MNDTVQLYGADLERARELMSRAEESLRQAQQYWAELSALVLNTLAIDRRAVAVELTPGKAFDSGYAKLCSYDEEGHCLGCWEDPPGECRPCTDTKPGPMSPGPLMTVLKA